MKTYLTVSNSKRSLLVPDLKAALAFVLTLCFLIHGPRAAAQAANSLVGNTFSGIFTNTSGWAPPPTRWLLLMASSGNSYEVAYNDSGTYWNYSASGAIGTANFEDAQEGSVVGTFTFATVSSGTLHLSNPPSYADGEFEFFSGSAPDSVAGNVYSLQIEHAAAGWPAAGSLMVKIGAGDSYEIVGDGVNTTNSSGSYSYSRANLASGKLLLNDSLTGNSALYLSFSNSIAGGFTVISPPLIGSARVVLRGHFSQLPTLSTALQGGNIVLSWPTNFVGFRLQRTVQLGSGDWIFPLAQFPVVTNGYCTVTIPITSDQRLFYRLSNQ